MHFNEEKNMLIRDLFTDDSNYWSLSRIILGAAFVLTTIAFIKWSIIEGFNESLFTTYIATWAVGYLGSKGIDKMKKEQNEGS